MSSTTISLEDNAHIPNDAEAAAPPPTATPCTLPKSKSWRESSRDDYNFLDIGLMAVQIVVAVALLVNMWHIIYQLKEEPVYGSLSPSAYDWSLDYAKIIMFRCSLAAGGYVLLANVFGAIGRFCHIAPFYGLYYCSNVFGVSVCMMTTVWPIMLVARGNSYCLAAEDSCKLVDSLAACPYPHMMRMMVNNLPSLGLDADGVAGSSSRWLQQQEQCCYLQDFEDYCSQLIGAAYTQCIISAILAALLMAQGCVSCCIVCCDSEIEWADGPVRRRAPSRNPLRTAAGTALPLGDSVLPLDDAGGGTLTKTGERDGADDYEATHSNDSTISSSTIVLVNESDEEGKR